MTETQPLVPEVVTAVAIAPTQQPTMSMLAWWKPRNSQEAFVLSEKLAETDLVPKEYYRKPNNIHPNQAFQSDVALVIVICRANSACLGSSLPRISTASTI